MRKVQGHQHEKHGRKPLSATIAYLRLWKMCDAQLSRTRSSGPAGLFDVIPLDEAKIVRDLRKLAESDLNWVDDPAELRSDVSRILELYDKEKKTQQELAEIESLRRKFQNYALRYSGDVAL